MAELAPKPITLVSIDPEDYSGPAPQPFAVVGGLPAPEPAPVAAEDITDATETGVALVTAATAAAGRTALGLGSLATASTVTSAQITDATIVNADISATAAIAATKVSVAADATNGVSAGTLQVVISALAARIQALEETP